MIAIVVLGAGGSTRMRGRDKLLEEIDGVPLLRRQVMRALDTGMPVLVTLPVAPHERYAILQGLEVTTVPVPLANEGMAASMRAAIAALPAEIDAMMVVLGDMPDIEISDMNSVLKVVDIKSKNLIWRATTPDGAAGHPIVFSATLFDDLAALRGDQGGNAIVKAHSARTVSVALQGGRARTDLDTPEAWAQWRAGRIKP
jgi:CTP:molybdopterin cytidylyltransferase MocA